jgi:hypothetical protein
MTTTPNAQYNVAKPDSLAVRTAGKQRKRMFEHFMKACSVSPEARVLDIGVTSDQTYESSNYVEALLENKSRITAAGVDDASFLEQIYPGLRFVSANGLDLPFEPDEFDIVHSSAVIEHVGSFENQVQLLSECGRVAKHSFYVTTPNRFFPIEFHTVLPLVHWLPKTWFRWLMRRSGREFFAEEENLNLMTRSRLPEAARQASGCAAFDVRVETVSLFGWPSNLLLIGTKRRNV